MKTQIAIACQGGGGHAAFTVGVFKFFFENNIQDKYEIVSDILARRNELEGNVSLFQSVQSIERLNNLL